MPDLKIEPELTSRQKAKQERLRVIAESSTPPTVKVWPANDEVRRLIKHPNGQRFRTDGGAEWPHDSFTIRRIRDGSVAVGGAPSQGKAEKTEGKNAREIAYARRPKEVPPAVPIIATKKNDDKKPGAPTPRAAS